MEADMIIYSTAIFDSLGNKPFDGGVAIYGKKILAVGSREEVSIYQGQHTVVKEFKEQMVMPGIIDSHGHFSDGAEYFYEVACHDLEACNSEEECVQMIWDFVKEHPELERYNGQGWYLSYWGEGVDFPTCKSLDKYISDKPVYLVSSDLHSLWMNSKAIEECNLKELMEQYDEELILRFSDGEPTGVVRELSFDILGKLEKPTEEMIKQHQEGLLKELNKMGITGFSDVSFIAPESLADHYKFLKQIENSGQLTVRIYIYPGTNHQADKIHEILPYKELFYSDEMHITGVKGILDGVTATYTAVMTEPYQDNPGVNGILVVDKDTIQNWVSTANANGLSCRIHCIGDGAVREALDAYEASNAVNDNSNIRNGVEHIEMLHPDDVNRFHELGVVASMQPRHQILDKGEKLFRCGLERSKYEWNFKAIRDTKGRIALGTDYPVVSFNPYENIYIGMTTRSLDGVQFGTTTREQVLTLEECLKGYTIEGAYLNSMEQKVGTLEPGKYADINVVNCNMFDIDIEEIKNCHSTMTIFNGAIVYDEKA